MSLSFHDCKKSIWYVAITDFPEGMGSSVRTRSMCDALSELGYDVNLLIPYALGHGPVDSLSHKPAGLYKRIRYEYINLSRRRPATAFGVAATKVSSQVKIAIRLLRSGKKIQSLFFYNLSYYDCFLLLLVAFFKNIPTVLDVTDEWYDDSTTISRIGFARFAFQRLSAFLENLLFDQVKAIITVSEYFKLKLIRNSSKLFMLPAIIPCDRFINAKEDPSLRTPGFTNILYVGNISKVEGIERLIEAVGILCAENLKIRLTLLGKTTMDESIGYYHTLIESYAISDAVNILPPVSSEIYPQYLKSADILVAPRPRSKLSTAGFPYKVIEYLASGKPMIVTKFGDMEKYLQDGVDCFMCEPDDALAIAEIIRYILENPTVAKKAAAQGQKRAKQLFDRDSAGLKLQEIIDFIGKNENASHKRS